MVAYVRQELMHHMFTKLPWCERTDRSPSATIDRFVFAHNFVLPRAGYSNGRNMRVTPQAVVVLNPARQLNHLQRATEIHVQTLLFGLRFKEAAQ